MARIDIYQLEAREELPNGRNDLIRDVRALRATHKQRAARKPRLLRLLGGEVAHVAERRPENIERDAELLNAGDLVGAVKVAGEEESDGEVLG